MSKGSAKARQIKRANILLMSHKKRSPKEIHEFLGVNKKTIQIIKERYLQGGLGEALSEKPRPGAPVKFAGRVRAKLTALACTEAPEGHAKWSLRLLSDRAVELGFVDEISHSSVGMVLKKTRSSPI